MFARKYPRMVFQHSYGVSSIISNGQALPLAYLGGLNSRPYECDISIDSTSIIGVSFYPDALHGLFGMNASALVDSTPELVNFMPRDVIDRVMEANGERQQIKVLEDYFLTRLMAGIRGDCLFNSAWQMINANPTGVQLRSILHLSSCSERHFRRRFQETTGYSPKQFLRITRFEKALEKLNNRMVGPLTGIAYECGYTDQSHFIREFREFAGVTPSAYLNTNKLYSENAAFIPK